MDGAKTCCEIGSKINRLLDDCIEQLSALCVGRHKAQISLQQKIKKPFTEFHRLSAFGVFTPHWSPNVKFLLPASILSWNDSRKLSTLVLLCFRAVQSGTACNGILLKKYLPETGSFKHAHSYFRKPLCFWMNRRKKRFFTGWPPVLIFSKEQEKEKPVCECVWQRQIEREKRRKNWRAEGRIGNSMWLKHLFFCCILAFGERGTQHFEPHTQRNAVISPDSYTISYFSELCMHT